MTTKSITLAMESTLYDSLLKRAKKEMCDINELSLGILRRSMLSYKKTSALEDKTDDSLVRVFSRQTRGRKRKN